MYLNKNDPLSKWEKNEILQELMMYKIYDGDETVLQNGWGWLFWEFVHSTDKELDTLISALAATKTERENKKRVLASKLHKQRMEHLKAKLEHAEKHGLVGKTKYELLIHIEKFQKGETKK